LIDVSDGRKMKNLVLSKKVIVAALGVLLLAAISIGCTPPPEPVTAAEFVAAAETLSFEIFEDLTDDYEHLAEAGVISTFAAERGTASIIFDIFVDEDSARNTFAFYSNGVEELFASPQSERELHLPRRNFHERRSPTALTIAIRVDNTVMGASAETTEDVAAVDALIEALGYQMAPR